MKFIVHIGVNKTGTSSLQRAYFDNRDLLAEQGIFYPQTGIETAAHHNVARALGGAKPAALGMAGNWQEELRKECAGKALCVLSSELFHTLPRPEVVTALCPPGDTRIVIYIREHAAHIVSWYQQAIQSRNTSLTLEEFVEFFAVSYAKRIAGWQRAYGAENVVARLYDRKALKAGDIVADFSNFVQPGIEAVFRSADHASNPSIAGNLLFVKRLLNCFLSKPESLAVANEVAALASLDPSFAGKIAVEQGVIDRIRFLSRGDRNQLKESLGLVMRPRKTPIAGTKYPDFGCLGADLQRITEAARQRNFRLADHLQRMIDIFEPVLLQPARSSNDAA